MNEGIALSPGTPVAAGIVRWGQGPLSFELHSSDEGLLSRAATIFGSWPPPARARLARWWRVERASSPDDEPLWNATVSEPGPNGERPFRQACRATSLVSAIEFDVVRELLDCPESILGLHGGLLTKSGPHGQRGVAVVGPCFSGKSTLSCALWRSGWSFLGDDVTLFDDEGCAYSAPRRASMRETSRPLVGDALWLRAQETPSFDRTPEGFLFHPHETGGQARPDRTRLAAIVFLNRRNAEVGPADLHRLTPVQAALALLPYSNLAKRLSFASALSRIAPLAERVPTYDLGRGPLPAMIAQVDALGEGIAS